MTYYLQLKDQSNEPGQCELSGADQRIAQQGSQPWTPADLQDLLEYAVVPIPDNYQLTGVIQENP